MRMHRTLITTAVAAFVLSLAAGPAQAAGSTATVSVLHGVPGLTVDVYANGEELIPGFEPGTLTDPQELPAGTYDLAVFAEGEGPDGDPAIEAEGVEVPAGANITVVAHLSADGTPTLTPFVNNTGKLDPGKARVTVRHLAAAPAVDVRANESVVFSGLTNPNEETAVVDAGTISADVVLAGTDTVAIGPADLDLAEGTNTIVYAWGSAEDTNLDLAVQTISGLHSAPSGVPSGSGGLVNDGLPLWLVAVMVLALGGAAAGSRRLTRAQAR